MVTIASPKTTVRELGEMAAARGLKLSELLVELWPDANTVGSVPYDVTLPGADSTVASEAMPPGGFTRVATTPAEAIISGNLHIGPTCGTVTTAWSPEEGTLVYVGDSEGMTVGEAQQLVADLQSALGRVAGL